MSDLLAILCGGAVGFSLALTGGGGSILATPLLLYVVGVQDPHIAIGTGAFAVAINAFTGLAIHNRAGNVRWRSAIPFALVGVVGAALGSTLGKAYDGRNLLFLFAILMIVVGALMLRPAKVPVAANVGGGAIAVDPTIGSGPKIGASALMVGALSGFFGIGGGFLVVPGLLYSTGMPMINAIGSSLLAVGAFGITTAANYALSGLIAWGVAAEYIVGGILGGFLGMRVAVSLSTQKNALKRVFATVIFAVAAYMLYRNAGTLAGVTARL